ncbi:MAG: prolyl oligopeptidase family serine peptidase [Parashewanella sp.]
MKYKNLAAALLVSSSLTVIPTSLAAKALSLADIMKFETLSKPVIADFGQTLAVEAKPDRGDSRVIVKVIANGKAFNIKNAAKPQVSADGRFVAMVKTIPLLKTEKADVKQKKKLKSGLVLLDTQTGEQQQFESVKSFAFNESGSHLIIRFEPSDAKDKSKDKSKDKAKSKKNKIEKFDKGHTVRLLTLLSGKTQNFENVTHDQFDKTGRSLLLSVNDGANKKHSLIKVDLNLATNKTLFSSSVLQVGELALSEDSQFAAFTTGNAQSNPYGREYNLNVINLKSGLMIELPKNQHWKLNRYSKLQFSDDSKRLFFGTVPEVRQQLSIAKVTNSQDLYSNKIITGERQLRVWHGDDPLIKPNEVKQYKQELKRTYLAVYDVDSNTITQLANRQLPNVHISQQSRYLLADSSKPYKKMITWAGFFKDVYLVDMKTGKSTQVLTQYPKYTQPTLSPDGKFLAYYQLGQIYLYNVATGERNQVSKNLPVSFANEDHDYPSNAPGYGFGPWQANGNFVLVYDKFDIWKLDTKTGDMTSLTAGKGRKQGIEFRVTGLPKDDVPATIAMNEKLLINGYNVYSKSDDFYRLSMSGELEQLTSEPVKLKVLARSKKADTLVYSEQRYDMYPDLYTANYLDPQIAKKQTNLNQQIKPYNWGSADLVHWTSANGQKLDGVLIKPANYKPGKRLPVLVYFYRFMSDRLHSFPQMKINHRPNFAWYVDNGYAVFLPDIRFEVGYPGPSSVQALTSGVQHLIDLGVADPNAVGIQGHSWGGYQTAYAVTQTNIFKAAVTGAPVSNMTSAYSGIRLGSGLARQFQYEMGQSRIGESLYKAPQKYIENSPIFYVDRIQTPMMIMFGDRDDAVPWEQGIEMYLAMRRAGKDVVMLQYQDEPHHLKKYPNKLDYTIKMKQYFDHYLKGKPAPEWLSKGEAYYEYKKD